MTVLQAFEIAGSIILSVCSAGVIIFGLANWLGKVWANRILEGDRARHAQEIEGLKSQLSRQTQETISRLETELAIFREKQLRGHSDKIYIYRLVTDIVSDLLADLDLLEFTPDRRGSGLFS